MVHQRQESDTFDIEIGKDNEQHISPLQSNPSLATTNDGGDCNFLLNDKENDENIANHSMKHNIRRWSISIAKGAKNKKTLYQKTIRFMPSRMSKAMFDGDLITNSQGNDIDQITMEIENRDYLMENTPVSEKMRLETIKLIPQTLSTKREIRAKISKTMIRKSTSSSINWFTKLHYALKLGSIKISKLTKNIITNFELFYKSMKTIEGHYGNRISAYFKFLRWLFILNFMIVILAFVFITFPQILYNMFELQTEFNEDMDNRKNKFQFSDLFTFEGYFSHSVLFYGGYTKDAFSVSGTGPRYNLPFAYFLTMGFLYIVTFIVVSISMARSYRRSFIETSGSAQNLITHKVFCAWDFGISNEKAANLKHGIIAHEFKEILESMNDEVVEITKTERLKRVAFQISIHLLVFVMIMSLGTAIWHLLKLYGADERSFSAMSFSLVVNSAILIFNWIFNWISKIEKHQASTALNINLIRNFLLQITILAVLMIFWLTRKQPKCWETSFGQEIHRLVITDFFISTCLLFCIQMTWYLVARFFRPSLGLPKFCIVTSCLSLVYNQSLLWIGMLFSPTLAIFMIVKFLFLFYIKKFTLLRICKPPSKLWRSCQTHTLFLVLTFVSLLGVLITQVYIMTRVKVSQECGPFRGKEYMYQIFMEGILQLKAEHPFRRIFILMTKPAIFGGILLTMCVVVYYLRAKSKAQIAKVKFFKELLCLEAKDKEFLLANISKITRGKDFMFDADDQSFSEIPKMDKYYSDKSGTWKFESPKNGNGIINNNNVNGQTQSDDEIVINGYHNRIDPPEETLRLRR